MPILIAALVGAFFVMTYGLALAFWLLVDYPGLFLVVLSLLAGAWLWRERRLRLSLRSPPIVR